MKKFLYKIILILFCLIPSVSSADILAVQSLPIKPYNDALNGFRTACNSKISRIVGPALSEADIATRVRRSRPELILAIGMDALEKLKRIKDVPIVYVMVLSPQLIVQDNANITGVSMKIAPEKQISMLREILPHAKKIGIFFDPDKSGFYVGRVYNAASLMGIELITKKVQSSREAVAAIGPLKGKVDALWLIPDTTVVNQTTIDLLLLSSLENNIPVITFSDKYAEKGALLSLEVDPVDAGKQAGEMANRLLGGADIRKMSAEDARSGILTVNLLVAKKLGIRISANAINHARVIR